MTLARITIDLELQDGSTPVEEELNVAFVDDVEDSIARSLDDPYNRIVSWRVKTEWPDEKKAL